MNIQYQSMKIALIGYGRMGREIHRIWQSMDQIDPIIIDDPSELIQLNENEVDVAVEFTHPESAFDNISYCLNLGVAVVSGTTGWLQRKHEIEYLCNEKNGAFLYASNFSIGVNVFFAINRKLAELMSDFEQYRGSIHEIHHITKKDAPSGTAISLAQDLVSHNSNYEKWAHEEEPESNALNITSARIEDAPGTHIIKYESTIDEISISHEARSREGFARGAIHAAQWIKGKSGVFTMEDVLGIK